MAYPAPRAVLVYGLLGLIPFIAPPVISWIFSDLRPFAGLVQVLYGALILSFLGGARWGLAIAGSVPRTLAVSLAMLPTIVGLGLLLLPASTRRIQLCGLALALGLHWIWDLRGRDLPVWYAGLRTLLTVGAVAGLVGGVFVLSA